MSTIQTEASTEEVPTTQMAELGTGIYAVGMLLSAGWICISLLQDERFFAFAVVAGLVALTLFCRTWMVGFVYFAALGFLLIAEPAAYRSVEDFDPGEVLYAISIIMFLITSSRYLVLTSPVLPYGTLSAKEMIQESIDFTKAAFINSPEGRLTRKSRQNARLPNRHKRLLKPEEFLTTAARVLLATMIAYCLLKWFGPNPAAKVSFGLRVSALRAASLAWFLTGLILVLGLLFTPISWLRHSPRQAGVYLRAQLTRWCFGDLRRIVRHLIKTRQKATVRRLGKETPKRVPILDEQGTAVRAKGVGLKSKRES
ncbi:MAG: hypothetical protein AB8G99_14165 [Planctomycetaceae bacterium]